MSSYHSKFKYLEKDSKKDFGWIIVHFDADQGEMDSYLAQEQVYTDSYNGTRRILYGTKWNEVAIVKITVVKQDSSNFTLSECRDAYRWLTGNPNASWLDLYIGDEPQYSFLGTVQDVKPQKLDARTIGMNIYFESISPWAYSPLQTVTYAFEQSLSINDDSVLSIDDDTNYFNIDSNGVLYANNNPQLTCNDGVVFFDNTGVIKINNSTDDLYSYIYLDVMFKNKTCEFLSIKNTSTDEETLISDVGSNELITISSNQFITSNAPNKLFGNTFNYVWPRLVPGENEIVVDGGGGEGYIKFTYRYAMKVSDCAIDIDVMGGSIDVCD